jgi:hypothetical protein
LDEKIAFLSKTRTFLSDPKHLNGIVYLRILYVYWIERDRGERLLKEQWVGFEAMLAAVLCTCAPEAAA